jgi:hypothetical protein
MTTGPPPVRQGARETTCVGKVPYALRHTT